VNGGVPFVLSGETNATVVEIYPLSKVPGSAVSYWCFVTDGSGSVESSHATLTVI
jgi:hypothetical protein